jgi:hypothetical protein
MATTHSMPNICHVTMYHSLFKLPHGIISMDSKLAIFLINNLIQWHKEVNLDRWMAFHDCFG